MSRSATPTATLHERKAAECAQFPPGIAAARRRRRARRSRAFPGAPVEIRSTRHSPEKAAGKDRGGVSAVPRPPSSASRLGGRTHPQPDRALAVEEHASIEDRVEAVANVAAPRRRHRQLSAGAEPGMRYGVAHQGLVAVVQSRVIARRSMCGMTRSACGPSAESSRPRQSSSTVEGSSMARPRLPKRRPRPPFRSRNPRCRRAATDTITASRILTSWLLPEGGLFGRRHPRMMQPARGCGHCGRDGRGDQR